MDKRIDENDLFDVQFLSTDSCNKCIKKHDCKKHQLGCMWCEKIEIIPAVAILREVLKI